MPEAGPATITVPGAVRGWEAVHGQGAVRPWAEAFGAAIDAAEGAPVSTISRGASRGVRTSYARIPGSRRSSTPTGCRRKTPSSGSRPWRVRSQSSRTRAPTRSPWVNSPNGFVAGLRALGAPISSDDLAAHTADLLPPLRGRYRDLDVSVTPPPSQGFVLLEALAAVERLDIDPDPIGADATTLARILMAASSDRDRHLADPEVMTIHVSGLLDDGHIAALCDIVRGGLDGHPASGPVPPRVPGDTIALVTADADGWGVSLIQSLFSGFGAGILEPSTGIIPHDRGACFTLEPGHPNELAPGKRPAHTLMPWPSTETAPSRRWRGRGAATASPRST